MNKSIIDKIIKKYDIENKDKETCVCEKCGNKKPLSELVNFETNRGEVSICLSCRVNSGAMTIQDVSEYFKEIKKNPKEIKSILDTEVIGQEETKKTLSVEIYQHLNNIINLEDKNYQSKRNHNILMIGESGTGKTLLMEVLGKYLNIPIAFSTATTLTPSAYSGNDIESVLTKLLEKSDGNVKLAECGIVFIDEIDKIAKKPTVMGRDVSGESVQQGLLTILHGSEVTIPMPGNSKLTPLAKTITINTSNILFIVAGAFVDIENIVKNRLKVKSKRPIGFNSKDVNLNEEVDYKKLVNIKDLIDFGIIPEFLGRFSRISVLNKLKLKDYEDIISLKGGFLDDYIDMLKRNDIELKIDKSYITSIANKAFKSELGARELKKLIADSMEDFLFEVLSFEKEEKKGKKFLLTDKGIFY